MVQKNDKDSEKESLLERMFNETSEKLADLFVDVAKCETTEAYFEGRSHEGVFIDSNKSDDAKASDLLGLFEMMCMHALSHEHDQQRVKSTKLPRKGKLGFIFLIAQATMSELWNCVKSNRFTTPSIDEYFKQRRYTMAIKDRCDVEFVEKNTINETCLMSSLPFNETVLIQARDVARGQGFENFAGLLERRLQCENVPKHPRYILSTDPELARNMNPFGKLEDLKPH